MKRLKRILMVNEASYLSTGYSTYGREVLSRFHQTGKYEIAELASYGHYLDPRSRQVPWTFYANAFTQGNQEEEAQYQTNPENQFGAWRFEEVANHFRPDIVIDIRDYWMNQFLASSPYRKNYNLCLMPTVDAAPQEDAWIDLYASCDGIFTYNDWSLNVLKEQGCGLIPLRGSASPGANLDIFKPVINKKEFRANMGFRDDILIVGTVMRNQKRKLFPDLMEAFAGFLKHCKDNGNKELADKTYLYLHTTYPDLGWDIPKLVKDNGLSMKCLFSYMCKNCGHMFPSFFQDAATSCVRCGQPSAGFPSTSLGITSEQLCNVYNLFDVYVQYSNMEGFGMPMVEAAACGIPVFATDYSAMTDVVRKLKGFPVKVERMYTEAETQRKAALPDNKDFIEQLYKFLKMPNSLRVRKGIEARIAVEKNYTYEQTAKKWENYFDSVELNDNWNSPPDIHNPYINELPQIQSNQEFVVWCYENILRRPDLINRFEFFKNVKDLNYGARLLGRGGISFNDNALLMNDTKWYPFDRDTLVKELLARREKANYWESKRVGLIKEPMKHYIEASIK